MFDSTDWSKLGGLLFVAQRLVDGLFTGRHASWQRGTGSEFYDYRAYCPGDDLTDVDWKLYGRTDRYYLRRYQRFTELQTYLMMDCSCSMDFAGLAQPSQPTQGKTTPTKLQIAATLAGAIAYLTIRQSDQVGLGLFSDQLTDHLSPSGSWVHLQRVCRALERSVAVPGIGDIAASLKHAHKTMHRRGLVVLISDLLDDPTPIFNSLDRLRHDRFEVVVFQVLTPDELDLGMAGGLRLRFIDAESRRSVSTDLPAIEHRYRLLIRRHLDLLKRGCITRGIAYHLVRTDQDPIDILRQYLLYRSGLPLKAGPVNR